MMRESKIKVKRGILRGDVVRFWNHPGFPSQRSCIRAIEELVLVVLAGKRGEEVCLRLVRP